MQTQPDRLAVIRIIVKKYWGYDTFRPGQAETLEPLLSGRDAFAVAPTGSGKSLVFQAAALALPGTALIISPLIALMLDQVKNAKEKGIAAGFINSSMDENELRTTLRDFEQNKFKIFYVSPERLALPKFRAAVANSGVVVSMVAVDECHCVSRTVDYRPAYARIHDFVNTLRKTKPDVLVLATTATATLDMEEEIAAGCALRPGYARIWRAPVRPEITLSVKRPHPKMGWSTMADVVKSLDLNDKHLVYTPSRGGAEKAMEIVSQQTGIGLDRMAVYHAGLLPDQRTNVQEAFTSGPVRVVFATCAFGMGIDIPNIRTVIHFGIPGSLEDYTQEIGRAGRDGKQSRAILLCSGKDDPSVKLREMFIESGHPPFTMYEKVWAYVNAALPDGGVMAKSGEVIVKEMFNQGLIEGHMTEGALRGMSSTILQVLSNMEAAGLVRRTFADGYMEITRTADLNTVSIDNGLMQRVVDWLAEQESDDFAFNRHTVCAALKISELVFQNTLKKLAASKLIATSAAYKGKLTYLLLPGVDLSTVLNATEIDKRHQDAVARLNVMVRYLDAPQYMGLPGDAGHRAYIESYFSGGVQFG